MRQRFLLGAYNRQRYMEDYQLLNRVEGDEEVLFMSTIVNRTMQSGYAEIMGMFPPTLSNKNSTTRLTER